MIGGYSNPLATLAARWLAVTSLYIVGLCILSACGGSDLPGPIGGTVEQSGSVMAGSHIQNAVVFLDLNDNNLLDSNERRTNTNANGRYTLTGLFPADLAKHAVVARIFPTATNTDTGRPAGLDCTLKAPAGGGALISPYSTLIAGIVAGSSATTVAMATAQIITKLKASTLPLSVPAQLDLSRDYVTDSSTSSATAGDSRQLRLLATSLSGVLSAVTAGLNRRQNVFDANSGFPFDTLVALTEAQLTQIANGTIAFGQLSAAQQAQLISHPESSPNFFLDGNAMLNAFISSISLSDLLPDIKNYIVNSKEFKNFFASVMVDLIEQVVDLLLHIIF